jgi:hypothetical protein
MNRFAAELCAEMHYPAQNLRSKSWDEFGKPGAPVIGKAHCDTTRVARRDYAQVAIEFSRPSTAILQ